jgi:large repetitive protein
VYSGTVANVCSAQPVNVAAITDTWTPATLSTYPGPPSGPQIGSASFAAGVNCSNGRQWEGIPLQTSTLLNWAHGWAPNYGLALTAPLTAQGAKEFYANDPYLGITYTPNGEGASYQELTYASPWNNKAGWGQVTVQNQGSATWTPTNGFDLSYEIYTVNGSTRTPVASATATPAAMTQTVAPGQSVTVTASIPALTPAPNYQICWDMMNGSTTFSSLGVNQPCYALPVVDNPPIIDSFAPGNDANVFGLTPTLGVAAHDPDNYPGTGLQYSFNLYSTSSTTPILTASALTTSTWTVPSGKLSYATTYYWTAQVSDSITASLWSAPVYFTVAPAQQPLLTSHLGAAPLDATIKGVDPAVGDYSTTVTDADASSPNLGPPVKIERTYNSLSPETSAAFGAGWSSVLDMRATPDSDGSGSIVVTLGDGRQERFGANGDGTFSPPAGIVAELTGALPGFGTGYTLIDQSGTRYVFTGPKTDPVTGQTYYSLVRAWDANGHGFDLDYADTTLNLPSGGTVTYNLPSIMVREVGGQNGTNGDTIGAGASDDLGGLAFSWGLTQLTTSTGVLVTVPHVIGVATNGAPFSIGNFTAPWTYSYGPGNTLHSVCPPASDTTTSTSCTAYSYTSGAAAGSHFASMVLDSNPTAYWRLDEAAGATAAVDSVAVNEGSMNAVASNVTFGGPGALAGSPATSASFSGTSSYLTLPPNLIGASANLSVGLWFNTTQAGGTLFSYQSAPPGTATSTNFTPALYIGTDGKLRGQFWDGTISPMTSASAVNDGKWHFAELVGARTNQTLYLDGAQAATRSGSPISTSGMPFTTVGAGELAGTWPAVPTSNPLGYFAGRIQDVSFLQHPLGLPQVQQEYASATIAAAVLNGTTLPSGNTLNTLNYDAVADRATKITDGDGGSYSFAVPTTSGSDAYYRGAAMATRPTFDYPMAEPSGIVATNSSGTHSPAGPSTDGTYNNVLLGEPGIFGPNGDTAAGFDGATSYLSLPQGAFNDSSGNATVVAWFKTTTAGGVLFSYQNGAIGSAPTKFSPALYIGADGKLRGQFWDGAASPIASLNAVDDGHWHLAEIAATGTAQTLYLDGVVQGNRTGASIAGLAEASGKTTVTVGAGYISGWPSAPSDLQGHFNGQLAQVGVYQVDIEATTPSAAASLYQARGSSTALSPTTTETVTEPSGKTETYTFDAANGERPTSFTDALGDTTTYAYDTLGFQNGMTDADGHTTSRWHDAFGNVLAETTCQSTASCQTSYFSYYENASKPLDPLNGKVLYAADARSGPAGTTNSAYRTSYSYTSNGSIASVTTPPTPDFPSGRTTRYTYYTGSESYIGLNGQNTIEPYGLVATVTDPAGAVTRYTYFGSNDGGDAGQVFDQIDPAGQVTEYSYDITGHLGTKCVSSDTYPVTYTSSLFSNMIFTCPEQWTYTHDSVGRPLTVTDPAITDAVTGTTHTPQVSYTYDPDGNVIQEATADTTGGDTTRTVITAYGSNDRPSSVTDPDGNKTTYKYDAYGNKTTETDATGSIYQYTYTPTGLPLSTTLTNYTGDPTAPSASAPLVLDSRAYDPAGRLGSDTDPMGRTTAYTYYDDNLEATETSAAGTPSAVVDKAYTYDAAGNKLTECDGQTPTGCTRLTTFTVDAAGRPAASTIDPAGADLTTTDHFDADNRVLEQILSGGGQSRQTSYSYDVAGNKISSAVTVGSDGPAGLWPLNDGAATTAVDSSGASDTASVSGGVSWGAPGTDSAAFDGQSGQIATTSAVVDNTKDYSVSAWVNLSKTSATSDFTAVSQDAATSSAFQLGYSHSANSWTFAVPGAEGTNAPATYNATGTTAAQTGVWTQVVGTFSSGNGTLTLYVNGKQVAQTGANNPAGSFTPVSSTGGTVIGRGKAAGAPAAFFPGRLHDVQVFNRALTSDEIGTLYSASTGPTPAAISLGSTGWWKLADGEAATAQDGSGNGMAAALSGDSYWSADHGGALVSDGTSGGGAATAASVAQTGGSFSVSAWVKPTAGGSGTTTAVAQQASQATGFALNYHPSAGTWSFDRALTDAASPTTASAVSTTAPGATWTQLVGVYNATTRAMTLYVNGAAQGTATDSTPIGSSGPLDIGHGFAAGAAANWFSGEIGDVQVYNRALSSTDASALFKNAAPVGNSASVTKWTYDERGFPTTMTDPRGNVPGASKAAYTTTYQYDVRGQLTSTAAPKVAAETGGGPATQVNPTNLTGYNTFGDVVESQDALAQIVSSTYDDDGNVLTVAMPTYAAPGAAAITPTASYTYDGLGRTKSVTDPQQNATSYLYDQLGNQVQVTEPGARVWHSSYDTDGERLSVTDPTGAQVQATYDVLGQQKTSTQVERTPTAAAYTTQFGYDVLGRMTSKTDPLGDSDTSAYNAVGDVNWSKDGIGNQTQYQYNLAGQPTKTIAADGTSTVNTYDLAGRQIGAAQLDASGNTIASNTFGYDPAGNRTSFQNAMGAVTTTSYDALNRVIGQVQPASAGVSITTSFGYDAAGNATRYTDPNGNATIYTFNALGLRESRIDPSVTGQTAASDRTTTVAYDADGRPTTTTQPGGVTITDGYDVAGNLTSQTGAGAEAATVARSFGYDAVGRQTSVSAPGGTESISYDDRGLPVSLAGPGGNATYIYDGASRVTSRTDATGVASFTYNLDSQVATQGDPLTGDTVSYNYTNTSQLSKITYGTNGATRNYDYDARHQLTSDTLTSPSGATESSIGYGYNLNGQINSETTTGTAGAGTSTFTYDQAGRLLSQTGGGSSTAYGYDNAGNRTSAGNLTASYNARNEMMSVTGGANSTSYAYTSRGTMLSATTGTSTTAYTDDAFGEQVTAGSGSYTYDGLGRLATAKTGGSTYTFAYNDLSDNAVSDGSQQFARGVGGSVLSQDSVGAAAGSGSFVGQNLHGDVTSLFTGSSGALTNSAAYTSWGQNAAGSTGSDLGYQGGWTDPGTGNVNALSRWYDPASGAFTSRDASENPANPAVEANQYAYGNDDPLAKSDPNGTDACAANDFQAIWANSQAALAADAAAGANYMHQLAAQSAAAIARQVAHDKAEQAAAAAQYSAWLTNLHNQIQADMASADAADAAFWASQYAQNAASQAARIAASASTGTATSQSGSTYQPGSVDSGAIDWSSGSDSAQNLAKSQSPGGSGINMTDILEGGAAVAGVVAVGAFVIGTDGIGGLVLGALGFASVSNCGAGAIPAQPSTSLFQDSARNKQVQLAGGTVTEDQTAAQQHDATSTDPEQDPSTDTLTDPAPIDLGPRTPRQNNDPTCLSARPQGAVSDNGGGNGWIQYWDSNNANGRSFGATACLTGDPNSARGTAAQGIITGWADAQAIATSNGQVPRDTLARCHLIAREFGGSGTDARNLAPCWQQFTNTGTVNSMRDFEIEVGDFLKEKGTTVVEYTVIPEYKSAGSTIPDGFTMVAVGWLNGSVALVAGDYVLNARLFNGKVVNLGN